MSRQSSDNPAYKHGHAKSKAHSTEYMVWTNMKTRCLNPNNRAFKWYGARGISICDRWMAFENFLSDMGPRPGGMTLERRDNALGYDPGNCYWATWSEQQNNRRGNRYVSVGGISHTIAEWSHLTGIRQNQLGYRLAHGWPESRLLNQPDPKRSTSAKLRQQLIRESRYGVEGQLRLEV